MNNKDGIVYLKNGKLNIEDPEGLGRYPRITAEKDVEILIAGHKEGKELVVSEDMKNLIEFKLKSKEKKKELNLEISNDKLKAYLKINIVPEQKLKLKDTEPDNHIIIETESIEKKYPKLTKKEIIDLLNYHNINYGIKHSYINELLEQKENLNGKHLIAEGKAAKAGQDAEVIKTEIKRDEEELLFNPIDSIEKGEVICYKKEAVPGKAGVNVFSERVSAPAVKDIELKAGKNVQIVESGLKAIALVGGQPKIIRRSTSAEVHINKQYVIKGDVNKYTGHIKYDGDLLVKGNVQDYFKIDVGNDIKVNGNIANAEVKNNGNLYVKNNIIASKLYIGNYLEQKIINKLKKIIKYLADLKKAVEEILGEAGKRQLDVSNFKTGKVIRLLVENKFKNLQILIQKTYKELEENEKLKDIFKEVIGYFNNMANLERITNENILYEFKDKLEHFLEIQLDNTDALQIYAGYIQNSEIKIGGTVIINKLGFYNSTIKAKGSIIAKSKSGFFRGGDYQAEEIIFAQKAGSSLGKTHFRIGEQIYIKEAIGTLIIKSEKDTKIIDANTKNINYKIDDYGKFYQASGVPNIHKYMLVKE